MLQRISFYLCLGLLLVACSDKEIVVLETQDYQSKYKPVLNTRNNDAKTSIDFGEVQKVWIAPYLVKNGSLVAGHDRYIWIRRPKIISGSSVPVAGSRKGVPNEYNEIPFTLHEGEINSNNNPEDDRVIMDYVNGFYKNNKPKIMKKIREQRLKGE